MHGQFSWYDLMTHDVAGAKKFYPSVTGWSTEDWKGAYTMWTTGGAPFAGMNPITPEQRAQGVPPHWLAYVTVDDVDASANKVRALGGNVMHGPEDIPEVGRFAIIEDPQGAMLAIFKSSTPSPGWDGTPSLGKFSWHELMTTDRDASFNFYRQLFGWEKVGETDMGPDAGGQYLEYGKNGKMYGGIFNRPARVGNMPPNWTFYVNVKDVNKSVEAAKRNGGELAMGPMEVPGGDTVAILKDAQGAMFALHQSKSAARPATSGTTRKKTARAAKKKTAARKTARKKTAPRKSARKAASRKRTAKKTPRRATARKRTTRKRGRRR